MPSRTPSVGHAAGVVPTMPVERCPVCGGAASTSVHAGLRDRVFGVAAGAWTIRRCTGCGAARLDPRPVDEAIAGLYARYYTHEAPTANLTPSGIFARTLRALRNDHVNARLGYRLTPAWRGGRLTARLAPPLAAIAERAVRSLPAGDRLLDVGCGNGVFVAEAGAAGWRASGIDLDAAAVGAGRAAGLDLAVETIEARAAREPEAFDAITLSHVLEHVADPVAFLRAARALLRPEGRVWIATPNLGAEGHRIFGADWIHLDPPRHLVLFDAPSLERALGSAGFTDVQLLRPSSPADLPFRVSAALRSGVCPANEAPVRSLRVRLRALAADLRAQRRPERAEELLVLARA